eukprot:8811927-Pyramimonas_sp.AAC.1
MTSANVDDGSEPVHSTRSYHRACRAILARGRAWSWSDLYEGQGVVAGRRYGGIQLGDAAVATATGNALVLKCWARRGLDHLFVLL